MADDTINIEIDGVPVQTHKGAMLIQAADDAGIYIPRFCYHKKLSVAANCRMCLVEVEKAPKPLPACATPVMDGMKVFTKSPKAIEAQKGTMEFLLINHPLDCPICDQGGECELQDLAMGYGGDVGRYSEGKRVVQDKSLGSLVSTDMTRCIHCTRCVRFGIEVAGLQELGATGRGEFTRIGTYVEQAMTSEMSGNVIDLCPVGALNAKPSRMTARAWELTQHDTIAPHDCVGSNLYAHTLRGDINRIVPRDNESINECWISDRDRFSYAGLKSEERLRVPMIKRDGEWRECGWDEALQAAAEALRVVVSQQGADQLGILVSPSATIEELALVEHIARGLDCANLDHRLRQGDFSGQEGDPVFPWLGQSIEDLEQVDAALLIGSNVRKEQPIVGHRLRKAAMNGAQVMFVNPRAFDWNFRVAEELVCTPDRNAAALACILKALCERSSKAVPEALRSVTQDAVVEDSHRAVANHLAEAGKAAVVLGPSALAQPGLPLVRALADAIAEAADARFGYLTDGANAAGAALAGVLPHRTAGGMSRAHLGLDARAMLDEPRRAYLLMGVEPRRDCWNPEAAHTAMNFADTVVALTAFAGSELREYADVLLPLAPFAETSGTYVNAEGRWQSFAGASRPLGQARPGWKVLRVLGNLLSLEGFDYVSSEQVRDELHAELGAIEPGNRVSLDRPLPAPAPADDLVRASGVNSCSVDALVRRSVPLQETADGADVAARIAPETARRLGLERAERVLVIQGNAHASMPLIVDASVASGCVWIPVGTEASAGLGPMYGPIELEAD